MTLKKSGESKNVIDYLPLGAFSLQDTGAGAVHTMKGDAILHTSDLAEITRVRNWLTNWLAKNRPKNV